VPGPFHSELTLPADATALGLARTYVEHVTTMAGLEGDDGGAVVTAALEACANVVDHAYEPGEDGTLTISADLDTATLTLAVRDHGLPIDATREDDDESPARASTSGGMDLIRRSVDSAVWVGLGRAGKELRLMKRLPTESVHAQLEATDTHVENEEDVPLAPEQEYEIRRFRPDDAVGISRVIYRVYGNTYLHDDCYYPDRLIALNESGELASVVAVDAEGEVVGHYALERPGLTPVAERGIAVVSPAHRGRDLMGRMRVFIEQEAKRLGLVGVFSIAVTKHKFSQKVNEAFGSDVTGFNLAGGPETQIFKGFEHEGQKPQRVTWVVYFTYVNPPARTIVFAPEHHRDMLERIYERLEIPVEWHGDEDTLMVGHGEVDVTYKPSMDNAYIRVNTVGTGTGAEIKRAARDLFSVTGAEAVFLELPLGDARTPALLEIAEEEGFFFGGLGPSFLPTGDALLMQRIAGDLDFDRIEVANPFGIELLDYIRKDRDRVEAQLL
jgi:anti-sigma regulatory factor (Ser/Thr protein kinase)